MLYNISTVVVTSRTPPFLSITNLLSVIKNHISCFRRMNVLILLFLMNILIFQIDFILNECPFIERSITIGYNDNKNNFCSICGGGFTCSDDLLIWNNGTRDFDFTKLINDEFFFKNYQIYSINSNVYFLFDSCNIYDEDYNNYISFYLNNNYLINFTKISNLERKCNCNECSIFNFFNNNLQNIKNLNNFKINYLNSKNKHICINKVSLDICYFNKNLNISDFSITSNYDNNNLYLDFTNEINETIFRNLEFKILNNFKMETNNFTFQNIISFEILVTNLGNIDSIFTKIENEIFLLNYTCIENNITKTVNCKVFENLNILQKINYLNKIYLKMNFKNFENYSKLIKYNIETKNSIDANLNNNYNELNIYIFNNNVKILNNVNTEMVGYLNSIKSSNSIYSVTNLKNYEIFTIDFIFEEKLDLFINITKDNIIYDQFKVSKNNLFSFYNNYIYTLVLYLNGVYEIGIDKLSSPNNDDKASVVRLVAAIAAKSTITKYTMFSKYKQFKSLGLNTDLETSINGYESQYFYISLQSSGIETSLLNLEFETLQSNEMLNIALINSLFPPPIDFQNDNRIIILPNIVNSNRWTLTSLQKNYLISIFCKTNYLKCQFNIKSYLTDENGIFLDNYNKFINFTYKNKETNNLQYITKLVIEKNNLFNFKIKLLPNLVENNYNNYNIELYIREDAFPTLDNYNYKFSSKCNNLQNSLSYYLPILNDKNLYIAYQIVASNDNDIEDVNLGLQSNNLVSLQVDFWLDDIFRFSDNTTISTKKEISNIMVGDFNFTTTNVESGITYYSINSLETFDIYFKYNELPFVDDFSLFFNNISNLIIYKNNNNVLYFTKDFKKYYTIQYLKGDTLYFSIFKNSNDLKFFTTNQTSLLFNYCSTNNNNIIVNVTNQNIEKLVSIDNTTTTISFISYISTPNKLNVQERFDGLNPTSTLSNNNKNDPTQNVIYSKNSIPYFFELNVLDIFNYIHSLSDNLKSSTNNIININENDPYEIFKTTKFRIEFTFWDILNVSDYQNVKIYFGINKIPNIDEFDKPYYLTKDISVTKFKYLPKLSDDNSNIYKYMMKYSLEIPSQIIYNITLFNSSYINMEKSFYKNNTFYFSIYHQSQTNNFEILNFLVKNRKIENELTYLPYTTYSLIGISIFIVICFAILFIGFTCKYFEKLKFKKITNFDNIKENDIFCTVCNCWFNLFLTFNLSKNRKYKQCQLFIPGLLFLFLGIIGLIIFFALSFSYSVNIVCCNQAGHNIVYLYNTNTDIDYNLYNLNNKLNNKCFIDTNYEKVIINDPYSLYSTNNYNTLQNKRVTIPILDKPSKGVNNALLLCARSEYHNVILRGSDTFGMIGTLICGSLFIFAFCLFCVLGIEIYLSSWYFEKIFWPKMLFRLTNE
ncbi:hypothetical protein ABK040_002864 [Willaertia magna]